MKSKKKRHELRDAAHHCGASSEVILRYVSYRWIQPADLDNQIFDDEDLARARLILELQENFGVNDEAIPIILHLIDQLNRTHLELKKRDQT